MAFGRKRSGRNSGSENSDEWDSLDKEQLHDRLEQIAEHMAADIEEAAKAGTMDEFLDERMNGGRPDYQPKNVMIATQGNTVQAYTTRRPRGLAEAELSDSASAALNEAYERRRSNG